MSIKVRWYNDEKTILYQEFEGHWTVDDYVLSADDAQDMLDSVSHPVYLITYLKGQLFIPRGFISAFRSVSRRHRSNERTHVIIGGGLLVSSTFQLLKVISPADDGRFVQVAGLDDAVALIHHKIQHEKSGIS